MKVTLKPPLRDLSTMFALEVVYKDKLLEQFDGKEERAKLAHDSWVMQMRPAQHHWVTFNKIAAIQTFIDMTPTERQKMYAIVRFE